MGLHVSLEPSAPLLQAGPLHSARPPTRRQKPQAWLPLLPKHRFGANTSSSASSCLRLPHMNSEHCTTNPPASDATTAAPMAAPTATTSHMLGLLFQLSFGHIWDNLHEMDPVHVLPSAHSLC